MVRQTSIIAFNDLKATKKHKTQKELILDTLRDNKTPMSLQEICDKTNFQINAVSVVTTIISADCVISNMRTNESNQ